MPCQFFPCNIEAMSIAMFRGKSSAFKTQILESSTWLFKCLASVSPCFCFLLLNPDVLSLISVYLVSPSSFNMISKMIAPIPLCLQQCWFSRYIAPFLLLGDIRFLSLKLSLSLSMLVTSICFLFQSQPFSGHQSISFPSFPKIPNPYANHGAGI